LAKAGYKHRLFLECLLGSDGRADTSYPPVNIRELGLADTDWFVKFRSGPGRALFRERIRTGQRCYAAIVNGRLASVSWVVQGSATLWAFTADFCIDDDAIYIFDSYTHPDFRGRRLQASIFQAIRRGYEDSGVRKAVTFVSETNTANLKSRTRLGFAVSGAVSRLRMGPFIRYSSMGNAPELRRYKSSNWGN
jgi:ribosomal protein S18 acetylase RimI-like enzyme